MLHHSSEFKLPPNQTHYCLFNIQFLQTKSSISNVSIQFTTFYLVDLKRVPKKQQSLNTEEQIRKLTTQQNLDELKRIQFILTKGQFIQKVALLQNLNQLLAMFPITYSLFISVIREILKTEDIQTQAIIGRQFKKIFQSNLKLQEKQFSEIVESVLMMLQYWNEKVSESWLQAFGALVQHKNFPLYEKKIMQLVIRLSDTKQILPMKIIAAKAASYLANIMKNKIKGVLLERIRGFCRDPEKQLRVIIMKQVMPRLFKNLSVDIIGMYFVQKIFEMVYDNQFAVRLATLQLILSNCEMFSNEEKQTRILNILTQNLESENEQIMILMSKLLGEIYIKMRLYLQKHTKAYISYLNCIVKYSKSSYAQVRLNFIYNLPGLVYYLDLKVWNQVKQVYISILLNDKSNDVRALSLLIFHQIVQICEMKNFKNYPRVLLDILEDFNNEKDENKKKQQLNVLAGLFENIDSIIITIQKQINLLEEKQENTQVLQNIVHKILQNLIKIIRSAIFHNKSSLSQKLHQRAYQILKYFNLEQLIKQYLPLLFLQMNNNNRTTIKEVIKCFCQILTLHLRKIDIEIIVKQLENQFLNSNVSFKNIIYIKISKQLLDIFSFERYRSYRFLENCLSFSTKKPFTVILELLQYIQALYRLYSLTPSQIEKINEIINYLKNSKQPLVLEYLMKIQNFNLLSDEEKDHHSLFRQIKNQQRITNEQRVIKETQKLYNIQKVEQAMIISEKFKQQIKKNIPFKPKKQNTLSKYASRLKAKINISLSTNTLNAQNQLKSKERLTKQQEKLLLNYFGQQKKEYQYKQGGNTEEITKPKKISLFVKPEEQVRIKRKKKPSIEIKNMKQFMVRDLEKRCSLEVTKRRKNVTEKKI